LSYKQFLKFLSTRSDTITTGLFSFEHNLPDIVIYYPSKQEIVYYKNTGYSFVKANTIKDQPAIAKIEPYRYYDIKVFPLEKPSLKITYANGTSRILSNIRLITQNYKQRARIPPWDHLEDSRAFIYDISFVEQWHSGLSGLPQYCVTVGDVDNDSKNEAIYTFFPFNDTLPQYRPTHMVVFENVSENQYRIEWDTIFAYGGYNISSMLTDFDRDGNKEFMTWGWDQLNNSNGYGIMECTGPGQYKYRGSTYGNSGEGNIFNFELVDSIYLNGTYRRGLWTCNSFFGTNLSNTTVHKYRYLAKSNLQYSLLGLAQASVMGPNYEYYSYSMSAADIDGDGKEEIILGSLYNQLIDPTPNLFTFFDSTGNPQNGGYEWKRYYFNNECISAGFSFEKDFDADGQKELVLCGWSASGGSIGVVKHASAPGAMNYNVMWWDSAGIERMPNLGTDTGYVDNLYTILYPSVPSNGPHYWEHFYLLTRNSTYGFYKTCDQIIDSVGFIGARLFDVQGNGIMHIVTPQGGLGQGPMFCFKDYEQVGIIGIQPESHEMPRDFNLTQNYPNPFNGATVIKFQVPKSAVVKITVYDILGKKVRTLLDERLYPGTYSVSFDAENLSSGIYFYNMYSDNGYSETKKMIMIK
jgi:hypothetical protein